MLKFAHKMSVGIIKFVVAIENWFTVALQNHAKLNPIVKTVKHC